LTGLLLSCEDEENTPEFQVGSLSFLDGGTIPIRHTCDGGHISPALLFEDFPSRTKSFALVMEVRPKDASPFVHWVMWGIESSSNFLEEDQNLEIRSGASFGTNSEGSLGYFGPCPIRGQEHVFSIDVFALDTDIALPEGSTRGKLAKAMDSHIIGKGNLTGRYKR